MTTRDKRIESLEMQQSSDLPQCCTVFLGPDEDADQKQAQGVSVFFAEYGHQPKRVIVISFVESQTAG